MRRLKRFFVYRVLHVDDTPHRIALGVAIGVFVAWTPTIGLQMILTVLLAAAFRANRVVGVPFVWISNPLTIGPIYGPNFLLGKFLLGGDYHAPDFRQAMTASGSWWGQTFVNGLVAWWTATWDALEPLWLGSLVVGLLLGVIAYFSMRYAVTSYRRHWHRQHPTGRKLPM